jgi:hypothetical protein
VTLRRSALGRRERPAHGDAPTTVGFGWLWLPPEPWAPGTADHHARRPKRGAAPPTHPRSATTPFAFAAVIGADTAFVGRVGISGLRRRRPELSTRVKCTPSSSTEGQRTWCASRPCGQARAGRTGPVSRRGAPPRQRAHPTCSAPPRGVRRRGPGAVSSGSGATTVLRTVAAPAARIMGQGRAGPRQPYDVINGSGLATAPRTAFAPHPKITDRTGRSAEPTSTRLASTTRCHRCGPLPGPVSSRCRVPRARGAG